MKEKYKILLEQKNEKIYLDNILLNELENKNISSNIFDVMHYRFLKSDDYCEIQNRTKYQGYNIDSYTKLLVREDDFERLKKEIYLFCNIAFHNFNIDGITDFSDMFQLLEYSNYLKEEGQYHYIKCPIGIVPTLCISKDSFDIKELEEQYNKMEEQKVKRLVK